jgi:hypothetical protein
MQAAQTRPSTGWRWFALLAIVASVLHTWGTARAGAPNLATFLEGRGGAFAPAASAFALIGAVHVLLVAFGVAQLTEHNARVRAFDVLAPLAGLASVLASFELVAASLDLAWLVAPLGAAVAACALALYLRAHRAARAKQGPRWLAAPFAVWLAWSAALLPAELAATGWTSDDLGVALVAALAMAGVAYGVRHRDAVLPAALAWLLLAMTSAQPEEVRGVAFLGGAACAAVALGYATISALGFHFTRRAPPQPIRVRFQNRSRYGIHYISG